MAQKARRVSASVCAILISLTISSSTHAYGNNIYVQYFLGGYLPTTSAFQGGVLRGGEASTEYTAKHDPGFAWGAAFIFPLQRGRSTEGLMFAFRAAYSNLSGNLIGATPDRGGTIWSLSVRYSKQWFPLEGSHGSSRINATIGPALIGHSGDVYKTVDDGVTVGLVSSVAFGLGGTGWAQIVVEPAVYAIRLDTPDITGRWRTQLDLRIGFGLHTFGLD